MLTEKFKYIPLHRKSGPFGRTYSTSDNESLVSVTTVLDATKSEESKAVLENWRKRVGYTKAKEITAEAAGRGTRMHKFLEDFIKTGVLTPPNTNPYSIQSHKMADIVISKGLANCNEYWGTEVPLYFPKVYAGTTDLCGIHAGVDAIMDHKQTNKPKKREWIEDYFIQLTAYATAHNEVHGTSIRKGVIFMCSADLNYQEFILEGAEFDKYQNLWWNRLDQYYSKFV